ncbi:MAG TPA: hypothetical protein VIK86_06615 [Candidatus Paceibacterota bacterium]
MKKIITKECKSIDELYRYIDLIESNLEKFEKRVSNLEKNEEHEEYQRYVR